MVTSNLSADNRQRTSVRQDESGSPASPVMVALRYNTARFTLAIRKSPINSSRWNDGSRRNPKIRRRSSWGPHSFNGSFNKHALRRVFVSRKRCNYFRSRNGSIQPWEHAVDSAHLLTQLPLSSINSHEIGQQLPRAKTLVFTTLIALMNNR